MSRTTLTIVYLSLGLTVAGCDKPQLNAVPDEQPQNLLDSPTATAQESTAEEQNTQPQESTDSLTDTDRESIAKKSQLADDTPVDPTNRKPFQFRLRQAKQKTRILL